MHTRELFFRHLAPTSEAPAGLEIVRAAGCYLYDQQEKAYLDLIAGISVCHLGHGHPAIKNSVQEQLDRYLHVMVYGEVILSPQVRYAEALTQLLPPTLDSVYFTNSGAEATEGAMKLAKRITGRTKIICFEAAYHGSTQGALSVIGSDYFQQTYRPLLPQVYRYAWQSEEVLTAIDTDTACVILELVQAEAGVRMADIGWLKALQQRCQASGTLLIVDEIQSGFGRTGSFFYFEQCEVIPDILLLGKALGAGLPLGAFISRREWMQQLAHHPVLGHITTFGGHPLSCAAGLAGLQALLAEGHIQDVKRKEALFRTELTHPAVKKIQSCGLLIALHMQDDILNKKIITTCLQHGVFTDWFLFAPHALRLAPPLVISDEEILKACALIRQSMNEVFAET